MSHIEPLQEFKQSDLQFDPKTVKEVKRRRTFAIISHPDAGKTTITEKLLLYGGAIHLAGTIKSKKANRHATSDWMEIEKERGISITSSVLQFDYQGYRINLLDTPGHQDFSEDTYRTLTVADCAVMLIDNAKGVETQTKKLFEVCRLRGLPIITFINKLDRDGRPPLNLMSEVEQLLGIECTPILWPIGMGREFKGVYHRINQMVYLYENESHGSKKAEIQSLKLDSKELKNILKDRVLDELKEDIELLEAAGTQFTKEDFLKSTISPVFFGSALTNFGVEHLLQSLIEFAPQPGNYQTVDKNIIEASSPQFSGFVFKIQANMDPSHRDRIAFLRICSGRFDRGMNVFHNRLQKEIKLNNPLQLLAQERTLIEEAYAGDIIGLFDTGQLRIGDTLSTTSKPAQFNEVPHFSPEFFAKVRVLDPLKRKQLKKGLQELSEEGAIQIFYPYLKGEMEPIIGAVGHLQFEIMQHRLENEYGAKIAVDRLSYDIARWVIGDNFDPKVLSQRTQVLCMIDKDNHPLMLFKGQWALRHVMNDFPDLKLMMTAPA